LLLAALLVGAAAAAAVVLNLVLLGRASAGNDPVGELRPQLTTVPPARTTPPPIIRPTHGTVENEGEDD
jgi:hypothetical protein